MKKYSRASFTVEASIIMPMTICVLLFLISLILYVHDYTWYTAAAWESVIGGCGEGSDREADISQEILRRAQRREADYRSEGKGLHMRLSADYVKVKAEYQGRLPFFMGIQSQDYTVRIQAERIRPVQFIRKYRAVQSTAARNGA